jgi:hypothetical protein
LPVNELNEIHELNGSAQRRRIDEVESQQQKPQGYSVEFRDAIKTGLFWVKWMTLLFNSVLMGFIGSYQKTYGLIYINDDIFLSIAATVQNVVNGTRRITWGFIFDYLKYKVGNKQAASTDA